MPLRVLWLALVLLSVAAHASALAACRLVERFELPVTMSGTRPMVHAKVNGHDVLLIADSGALFNTLSQAAAAELKLPLEPAPVWFGMGGLGGETRAWLTRVETFTLLTLTVPNVEFIVVGDDIGGADGLLGQSVFRLAGDVEYDLGHGVIRLFRADDCRRRSLAYWASGGTYSVMDIGHATPESPHTGGFAFLNGTRIRVTFDTGAAASMVTLEAARRAGITPASAGVVPAGTSYGIGRHPVQTWIAPFSSFRIGDEEIRNTHLRIGAASLRDVDMLVGADFFLSHRVYVANSQAKLYFTYNGGPVFDLTLSSPATAAPRP